MNSPAESFAGLFWLFVPVVAVVNHLIMRARAARDIAEHPEKKRGYAKLLWGSALIYLPFFYAGFAVLTGIVASPLEFFQPSHPGVALLLFHVLIAVVVTLMLVWVWLLGGLQLMSTHPAIFNLPRSVVGMKLFWMVMIVFSLVMIGYMLVLRPWDIPK